MTHTCVQRFRTFSQSIHVESSHQSVCKVLCVWLRVGGSHTGKLENFGLPQAGSPESGEVFVILIV